MAFAMTTSLLDAFDLVAHAELLELRLAATVGELSKREGLTNENAWLEAARTHVARAREGIGNLSTRVLRVAELEPARAERGRALQGAAMDAAEHVQAAIAAAGGERSPVLEAIFRNLKMPVMRRASRDDFAKFCDEIDKRLGSTYVRRMLADPMFTDVAPSLQNLRDAFAEWRLVFTSGPPTEAEEQALRDELLALANRLELPCRQARLLAEAALLPASDLIEPSGIFDKPRRRVVRAARVDANESEGGPPPPGTEAPPAEDGDATPPG